MGPSDTAPCFSPLPMLLQAHASHVRYEAAWTCCSRLGTASFRVHLVSTRPSAVSGELRPQNTQYVAYPMSCVLKALSVSPRNVFLTPQVACAQACVPGHPALREYLLCLVRAALCFILYPESMCSSALPPSPAVYLPVERPTDLYRPYRSRSVAPCASLLSLPSFANPFSLPTRCSCSPAAHPAFLGISACKCAVKRTALPGDWIDLMHCSWGSTLSKVELAVRPRLESMTSVNTGLGASLVAHTVTRQGQAGHHLIKNLQPSMPAPDRCRQRPSAADFCEALRSPSTQRFTPAPGPPAPLRSAMGNARRRAGASKHAVAARLSQAAISAVAASQCP